MARHLASRIAGTRCVRSGLQRLLTLFAKVSAIRLSPKRQSAQTKGTANCNLAAEILADLKEAIGGAKGATLVRKHAGHLTRKNPTLAKLKGSLRKCGILD